MDIPSIRLLLEATHRAVRSFVLQLEPAGGSPLDVAGVDLGVTTDEIVTMIREGRERYG